MRHAHPLRWLCMLACVAGCSAAFAAPTTFAVVPPSFTRFQISAGGVVDPLPQESEAGKSHLVAAFTEYMQRRDGSLLVTFPSLDREEQTVLEEHRLVFDAYATQVIERYTGFSRGKLRHVDYEIGPGLSFLAERYGVEKVVLVSGAEVSVSGPRAMMMLVTLVALHGFLQGGEALVMAAVVDTRTGAIEWIDFRRNYNQDDSPRTMDGARRLVSYLLQPYPRSRLLRGDQP